MKEILLLSHVIGAELWKCEEALCRTKRDLKCDYKTRARAEQET